MSQTTKSNGANKEPRASAKELREQHMKLNPKAPRAMGKGRRTTAIKRLVSKSEGKPSGRGWLRGAR